MEAWAATDMGGEQQAEPIPPKKDGLVACINAALMQQVLDVSKGQREPDMEHGR